MSGLLLTADQKDLLFSVVAKLEREMVNLDTGEDWDKTHNFAHVWRVIRYAEIICESQREANHFIALLAAVMHDIGRIVEAQLGPENTVDHGTL
ncbi:MAG: HD domain-containing protein [Patescibacteria group bacterium]|nr:HD domain-containing protein [Patescibacteria group bacterium]